MVRINSSVPPENYYQILSERNTGKVFLRKARYLDGLSSPRHYHENSRFVFVLQGIFSEKYERKERFCRPFTCIFRPPQEKHSEIYHSGVICLSVDIPSPWIKSLEDYSIKLNESKDFFNKSLMFLTNKICNEMVFDDNVSSLAIEALLMEVAVETHRMSSVSKQEKPLFWFTRAVEYIHENHLADLTLNDVALAAGVHPVHLARVFRKTYQCTVADYIRRLRVESASRMLSLSDLTLAQIAAENGFADQSHFTKVFKRLTNLTPARFRFLHGKVN